MSTCARKWSVWAPPVCFSKPFRPEELLSLARRSCHPDCDRDPLAQYETGSKANPGHTGGIALVLAASAYFRITRELELFERDMIMDHAVLARTLAGAMARVWEERGATRP